MFTKKVYHIFLEIKSPREAGAFLVNFSLEKLDSAERFYDSFAGCNIARDFK